MEKFKKFKIKRNHTILGGNMGMGMGAYGDTKWRSTTDSGSGSDLVNTSNGTVVYY